MGEGCQKSKRLPCTAKFRCDVVWCAEENGNHKAAEILGVYEMFDCDGNSRQQSASEASRENDFLKLKTQSSRICKRDARLK
jgi:hypothetical protein